MEDEFFIVLGDDGSPYYDNDGDVLIQRRAGEQKFVYKVLCF